MSVVGLRWSCKFVTTMAVELELGVTPIMENKDILDALMV